MSTISGLEPQSSLYINQDQIIYTLTCLEKAILPPHQWFKYLPYCNGWTVNYGINKIPAPKFVSLAPKRISEVLKQWSQSSSAGLSGPGLAYD